MSNLKDPKMVLVFNGAKVLISITRSMHSTALMTGTSLQAISFCCSGKYTATRGLYFRYMLPEAQVTYLDIGRLRLEEYDRLCGVERKYYTVREMARKRKELMKKRKNQNKPQDDE